MTVARVVTARRPNPRAKRWCPGLILILGAFALAACGHLDSAEKDEALSATSQSNLASLGEVIQKHPEDPQAYNMRGTVLAAGGQPEAALADFNKAGQPRSELRPSLCQPRVALSAKRQA